MQLKESCFAPICPNKTPVCFRAIYIQDDWPIKPTEGPDFEAFRLPTRADFSTEKIYSARKIARKFWLRSRNTAAFLPENVREVF